MGLCNLSTKEKIKYQITADVSEIKKSAPHNNNFIFDALAEDVITFVRIWLLFD